MNGILPRHIAVWVIASFLLVISSVLLFSTNTFATGMPKDFANFITNEKGKSASDSQADGLYNQLNGKTFSTTCAKDSSYKSKAVNGKAGGESFLSLLNWSASGAENLDKDWRDKSNALIKLLAGELEGGMTLEYSTANQNEGWCAYTVRMAAQVKIPISGKTVTVDDEDNTKAEYISAIANNCVAEFGGASQGILGTPTSIASFIGDFSDKDYNTYVAKLANAIKNGGAGATQCAELVTAVKPLIDAKVKNTCDADPSKPECAAPEAPGTSCNVDGVGWIICPVLIFTGSVVDAAYGFVASLLAVQPLLSTGGNPGLYEAWSVMRSIANVAFVIAFLIIIFAQLTGMGVSNYGVKKLLPRLVVAAILVNVSFWICAAAIDVSNIFGSSMLQIFTSIDQNIAANLVTSTQGITADASSGSTEWSNIIGGVLAGTAVAGAVYYVGLAALIPALLAALVAVVTVFLVLVLRQALIILLIVIAPLAFVAYLLPNTESLFSSWRKLLTTLLLMYPIIAGLFGASALASQIVMNGSDNVVVQIMGACISLLPLALTPVVMKFAGGILNRFAGIVDNKEKGPINRLQNTARDYSKTRRNLRDARALGGARQAGRGSFVKWRARRGAISAGANSERGRAEQQYIAGAMTSADELGRQQPTKFAQNVAGGSAGVFGLGTVAADPAALQRALAGAKFTIEKAELDDIKAEQSLVSNLQMAGLKGALTQSSNSPARQAAIMDRMIKIGNPSDYASHVDRIGTDTSEANSVLRRSVANSLRESGPGFLKASNLDAIATGTMGTNEKTNTIAKMAKENVISGVYSQEKLVAEATDNIKFAYEQADIDGKNLMMKTAETLRANDNLSGKIKHNAAAIYNLSEGKDPGLPRN